MIYIVIIEDRHSDTAVYPFVNKEVAIAEARKRAKNYCKYPEDYSEQDINGCLFYAEYSCESDSVCVVAAEVNKAIP